MSEKRKDNKGRVLRTGESQRNDLTYQFRYTDITGKRRTIYAKDLKELRKQEEKIQKDIDDGINYCEGNINVIELVERYVSLKQGVRHATKVGYNFVLNLIRKEDFCCRRINTIKTSDAKLWLMKLQKMAADTVPSPVFGVLSSLLSRWPVMRISSERIPLHFLWRGSW